MKIAKRIFLFVLINILIVTTLSVLLSALGIEPYLQNKGLNYTSLVMFCLVWGFGGAFISLALSRVMAKWMMGVKVIDSQTAHGEEGQLLQKVHALARQAGINVMPEVGIYEADEINAFATGPTKNRSLVAVSSGLLHTMNQRELEGVLAHEVAHIANGDMVTMTLLQGVVNAFVMFIARVLGFFASQFVDEDKRSIVQFGVVLTAEILLGVLGMIVVAFFSRHREYRADEGGAKLAGSASMIAALEKLKTNFEVAVSEDQPAIASLKISGRSNGFLRLFATHPELDDRIERLKAHQGKFKN